MYFHHQFHPWKKEILRITVVLHFCNMTWESGYILYYYTSEEFFLYKITVDKRTIHHFSRQNELLTGT